MGNNVIPGSKIYKIFMNNIQYQISRGIKMELAMKNNQQQNLKSN